MSIENKAKMIAALSLFQIATSTVSASQIKTVFIAQDDKHVVACEVEKLDRNKATQEWPGSIMDGTHGSAKLDANTDNSSVLTQINKGFAGGNYFDAYPHKLPDLFKKGACTITKK